jgi:hypothetical protein
MKRQTEEHLLFVSSSFVLFVSFVVIAFAGSAFFASIREIRGVFVFGEGSRDPAVPGPGRT